MSWLMVPLTPGVTLNVVVLMVAGFIASLKMAVTFALVMATLLGDTEVTVGGVRPGIFAWSGSPHPVTNMSIRNAVNQALLVFSLRTSIAFFRYVAPGSFVGESALRILFECAAQLATNTPEIALIGRTIGWVGFQNGKAEFARKLVWDRSTANESGESIASSREEFT